MRAAMAPTFERYGLALDNFAVENISLPDELQKAIDARISMGMVGDLGKYTQFQVAQAVPLAAQNEGGLAGVGAGLAAGVGMGQVMMDALRGSQPPAPAAALTPVAAAAAADDPEARLAKLKALLDKGLVTQADYDSAKAEILKKLIG
jgi:membrane protease subunit (stomatin/prohibitin family)